MKYLVMACHTGYAVVLDEDGRFLKVANRRYAVGQTVTDVVQMRVPPAEPPAQRAARWLYPLAAAAACLLLALGLLLRGAQTPQAAVYLSINPQVRIDVNRSDTVVSLTGLNEDGMALLSGYRYWNKPLEQVCGELLDRAAAQGFLLDGGRILLTLDGGEEWTAEQRESLPAYLAGRLAGRLSVTIEVAGGTPGESDDLQVIIPVGQDGGYGDSAYGMTPLPQTPAPTAAPQTPTPAPQATAPAAGDDGMTDYGGSGNDSGYGGNDGGDSGYGGGGNDDSGYGGNGNDDSGYGGNGGDDSGYGGNDDDDSGYGDD